jgi:hypothetical protein
VGRIKQLYLPGNEYDITTASKIFSKQCSSTVRTLLEAADGDVTDIIKTAESAPLNKKQREALAKWNKQKSDDEKAAENTAEIMKSIAAQGEFSRHNRLLLWKIDDDYRKQVEREGHWKALGIGQDYVKQLETSDEEKEMAKHDLPFD